MAQLSRPFQIALLALGVLVLAWFAVLHRPGGSSTSSSSPSVSSSASSSGGSSAAGSSSVYHGSAPGVEGLTRDIQRAHGAAAQVEGNARELQSKAAQSSGEAAGGGTPAAAAHPTARAHTGTGASTSASVGAGSRSQTHTSRRTVPSSASKTAAASPRRTPPAQSGSAAAAPSKSAPDRSESGHQAAVAAELEQGKVVLLLFWNPHSADDAAVERQVQAAARKLGRGVVVHTARAGQVDSFGSITRDIQIYQTPTLLIVNPHREVTTVTGYTDAFAIEQAVAEARK